MNEKHFSYRSHNGTQFIAERCDFRTGVSVQSPVLASGCYAGFSSDVAEMIGYHATNIWPSLNGFQGYDCITFTIK